MPGQTERGAITGRQVNVKTPAPLVVEFSNNSLIICTTNLRLKNQSIKRFVTFDVSL